MKLDLNLDLLKFHSFKMNNDTHNLTNFKTENFNEFEKKFFLKIENLYLMLSIMNLWSKIKVIINIKLKELIEKT